MRQSLGFGLMGLMVAGLGATSAHAQGTFAQPGPGYSSGAMSGNNMLNMYGNPATNPYLNPYLNPLVSGPSANPNNALLYLWSAQQMPGGLMAPPQRASAPPPAEMHRTGTGPAGGASRYFNRGTSSNDGSGRHYQRTNRYFGSNGR